MVFGLRRILLGRLWLVVLLQSGHIAWAEPPTGEEIREFQRRQMEEIQREEEEIYQQKLGAYHELEWEYLNMPARKYPEFYDTLRLRNLFPEIESLASGIHRVFWILSGACMTAGLVWKMTNAVNGRQAMRAVVICMILITLMGAAGPLLRWADAFVYEVSDHLVFIVRQDAQEEEDYNYLIHVLTGVRTSLERVRERVLREDEKEGRSVFRKLWEPMDHMTQVIVDTLIKWIYYVTCWGLEFVLALTLLVLVLIEQFRLLLIYLGFGLTPLLVSGLIVPGWQPAACRLIQGLVGVLSWPLAWVICFLFCNLISQPLIHAFSDIPQKDGLQWYEPTTLAVYLWEAYYNEQYGSLVGLSIGVIILCAGLLLGLWLVTRAIHRLISGGGGIVVNNLSSHVQQTAATWVTHGGNRVFSLAKSGVVGKSGATNASSRGSVPRNSGAPRGNSANRPASRQEQVMNTIRTKANTGLRRVIPQRFGRRYIVRKT